jgi:hypothetical protein
LWRLWLYLFGRELDASLKLLLPKPYWHDEPVIVALSSTYAADFLSRFAVRHIFSPYAMKDEPFKLDIGLP